MSLLTDRNPTDAARHDGSITIDDVSMDFRTRDGGTIHALTESSLQIPSGQFISVLGPSGCGKSTLLRIIAGLAAPTSGSVLIGTETVNGPSRQVGIAFQTPALLQWYTVAENIGLPAKMGKNSHKGAVDARVDGLLDMVKLSGLGQKYPRELSGGMRQRVAIARCLVNDPAVILMDEPFGALDAITREYMHDELLSIWQASGATVFFITHDISEAVYLSDRVIVMSPRPGRIVADMTIGLPRPRGEATRQSPEFARLAADLRQHISH
ncbi:NitT/TauT family transport system ATP-binding protein [Glaciihabitans tibetensis]|uniref:NitT/TauT family transport system ATP-binding protein n=1 Tax=Glaciihabitans tibetensis TaxID=1266600 RepID=A0A2T0VDZ9_9MICO|nr:ABC transporter ATP-binding protein [Glaciihabitans tibetensis]PRY68352.1 NitT/TauT family transport system ATP-binding protein [Glaciihabitans tibetensis]